MNAKWMQVSLVVAAVGGLVSAVAVVGGGIAFWLDFDKRLDSLSVEMAGLRSDIRTIAAESGISLGPPERGSSSLFVLLNGEDSPYSTYSAGEWSGVWTFAADAISEDMGFERTSYLPAEPSIAMLEPLFYDGGAFSYVISFGKGTDPLVRSLILRGWAVVPLDPYLSEEFGYSLLLPPQMVAQGILPTFTTTLDGLPAEFWADVVRRSAP